MGVGYVPTGSFRQEREGDDVPRRQHRGTRTDLRSLNPTEHRRYLGNLGEIIAAHFLIGRGATVVDRNVRVGRGEIDLIVEFGRIRVAVEVKTVAGENNPVFRFDSDKQAQVRSLAGQCGIRRVDFVGVVVTENAATIRWLPAAA